MNTATKVGAGLLATAVVAGAVALFLLPGDESGCYGLRWDPVADDNLAGYRLYVGPQPGVYDCVQDVPAEANGLCFWDLPDLLDCGSYFAVKAYNAEGLESAEYSNVVDAEQACLFTLCSDDGLPGGWCSVEEAWEEPCYEGAPYRICDKNPHVECRP